jgi:predicted ribosome quality control (RQC) complex YloA/Tae2 family protein
MDKEFCIMEKSKFRKSVFMVVYRWEDNKTKYLLLKRKLHWKGWEFPKGGVENNEGEEEAVRREIKEETGLEIKKIKKFDFHGEYKYKKKYPDRGEFIGQKYSLYAVEVNNEKVQMDEHEHSNYEWLNFEDAMKRLTWKNQKDSLKIVNSSLNNKEFRKMITKNGIVVLGGKDENSNEELVKQISPDEYVFHTAAAGSPFVNIKARTKGSAPPIDEDIREAAIFCAKYSRDWKQNHRDVIIHKFRGRDIFKKSGMKAGTFGLKRFDTIKVRKLDIEKSSS